MIKFCGSIRYTQYSFTLSILVEVIPAEPFPIDNVLAVESRSLQGSFQAECKSIGECAVSMILERPPQPWRMGSKGWGKVPSRRLRVALVDAGGPLAVLSMD